MADTLRINYKGSHRHRTGLKNDPSAVESNNAKQRLLDSIGHVDNSELATKTHLEAKGVNNLGKLQLVGSDSQGDKRVAPINVLSQSGSTRVPKKTRSGIMTIGYIINDRANAQSKMLVASPYWLRQQHILNDYVNTTS